jgi:tetratricopeptide (TPR) repeat protein
LPAGFAVALLGMALLGVPVTLRLLTPEVTDDGVSHPPPLTFEEACAGGPSGTRCPAPVSVHDAEARDVLTGPEACERCHADVVAQWSTSAHRHSGLDNPWYRSVLEDFQEARGAAAGRWCAGCHTPALLLAGLADRPAAAVAASDAATAGVSCMVCHGMSRVDSRLGQGDYDLGGLGVMHDLATSGNPIVRALHDLLVRVDPEPHRRTYSRPLLGRPEACAACHAAHFDEPVNGYRRFKYFDDYAPWHGSQTSGHGISAALGQGPPGPPRDCVDCHMSPARTPTPEGEAGRSSHRFAAANTALPTLNGEVDQMRAAAAFLCAGRVNVDLFAARIPEPAREGEAPAPPRLVAPLDRGDVALFRGETAFLDVVVSNPGVGHAFPGGKLDLHDVWLEVRAVDESGRTLFWSGRAEGGSAAEPTAHRYGALLVDEKGVRIERHEVWRARAEAWTNVIGAGDSQVVRYELELPPDAGEQIELSARLRHRKFRPEFTAWAFARLGQEPPPMPVLSLAEDSVRLPVRDRAEAEEVAADPVPAAGDSAVERWRAYGVGLAGRFERRPAQEAFRRLLEIAPEDVHGRVTLGWLLSAESPEGRAELEAALKLDDDRPLARILIGTATDDPTGALELLRPAAEDYPRDAGLRVRVGDRLFDLGEFEAARAEYEAAFAAAPETAGAHFGLMRTWTARGGHERARRHQDWYSFLRFDRESMQWSMDYVEAHPEDALEGQRGHRHRSLSLPEPGAATASYEEVSH